MSGSISGIQPGGEQGDDISSVLEKIVEMYEEEILQDADRVNALMMDLAPSNAKERKLIVMALKEGVLTQLYSARTHPMPDVVIKKCIKQLVSDIWITEEAARYAVGVVASVIGFDTAELLGEADTPEQNSTGGGQRAILKGERNVGGDLDLERALSDVKVIGFKAFAGNKEITSLRIPETVEQIMPKAFAACEGLERIEIGKNVKEISASAFDGCPQIKVIEGQNDRFACKKGILVDKREKIVIKAENRDNVNEIEIPRGITKITDKAFEGNAAEVIQIPQTVETIENRAFFGMSHLKKISVDPHSKKYRTIDGVLHDRRGETLIQYPMAKEDSSYYLEDTVKTIGSNSFCFVQKLKMLTLTGTLEKIEYGAFQFCSSLESLMLPYGVSLIGEKAFQYCIHLKSVMLSKKIDEIGDCAFYQCHSLESMAIPASVKRIGNYAFWGCKSLDAVTIQNGICEIGDAAFENCSKLHIKIKDNPYVENYCRAHDLPYTVF